MPIPPARRPQDLMRLLTQADRLSVRRLQTVLEPLELSVDAWRVMSLLSDREGPTMTSVAGAVFLPPPSLTKLVDQLVERNLVYRRVDPLDRRRILAYLTPRGVALWERLDAEVAADWELLGTPLADDDLLTALLARLVGTLDPAPRTKTP